MAMDHDNVHINDLRDLLARDPQRLVPVVGAGLSRAVGLLLWHELVREVAKAAKDQLDASREGPAFDEAISEPADYPAALDILEHAYGENPFNMRIRRLLRIEELDLTPLVRLTRLPVRYVLTTNIDLALKEAYANKAEVFVPDDRKFQARLEQSAAPSKQVRLIMWHGRADESTTWVLTRKQYDTFYGERWRGEWLQGFALRYTFLFIGYSLRDPDIAFLLNQVAREFRGEKAPHYALLKRGSTEPAAVPKEAIIPIWYDDHSDVMDFLEDLSSADASLAPHCRDGTLVLATPQQTPRASPPSSLAPQTPPDSATPPPIEFPRSAAELRPGPVKFVSGDAARTNLFPALAKFATDREIVFAFGGLHSGLKTFREKFEEFLDSNSWRRYPKADLRRDYFDAILRQREENIRGLKRYAKYLAGAHLRLKCLFAALAYSACQVLAHDYPDDIGRAIDPNVLDDIGDFAYHYFTCEAMGGAQRAPIVEHFFSTIDRCARATAAPGLLVFMPWKQLASWLGDQEKSTQKEVWVALKEFTAKGITPSARARPIPSGATSLRQRFEKVCLIVLTDRLPLSHDAATRELLARTVWPLPPLGRDEVAQALRAVFPRIPEGEEPVGPAMEATAGSPWFLSLLLSLVAHLGGQETVRSALAGRLVDQATRIGEELLALPASDIPSGIRDEIASYREALVARLGGPDTSIDQRVRAAAASDDGRTSEVEIDSERVDLWLSTGLTWLAGDSFATSSRDYVFARYPRVRLRRTGRLQAAMLDWLEMRPAEEA